MGRAQRTQGSQAATSRTAQQAQAVRQRERNRRREAVEAAAARVRFHPVEAQFASGKEYAVELDGVVAGTVRRFTASTDSMIKGTRLRRSGKGRPAWRATVPSAEADGAKRELAGGSYSSDELWCCWQGRTFDRREDAVATLLSWHLYPQLRTTEDQLR